MIFSFQGLEDDIDSHEGMRAGHNERHSFGGTGPAAALTCTPMRSTGTPIQAPKFAGKWLLATNSMFLFDCAITLNNVGVITASSCRRASASTGAVGTVSGSFAVTSSCNVTGNFHIVTSNFNKNFNILVATMLQNRSSDEAASVLGVMAFPPIGFNRERFFLVQRP